MVPSGITTIPLPAKEWTQPTYIASTSHQTTFIFLLSLYILFLNGVTRGKESVVQVSCQNRWSWTLPTCVHLFFDQSIGSIIQKIQGTERWIDTAQHHRWVAGKPFLSYVYLLYYVCIAVFTVHAGLLARSLYSEGHVTGHLNTGFSRFHCVYKQMLRWFPRFQVATTCFSCRPSNLNLLVTNFIFCVHENNHCHRVTTQLQLINTVCST
jgi:hypothetical protein